MSKKNKNTALKTAIFGGLALAGLAGIAFLFLQKQAATKVDPVDTLIQTIREQRTAAKTTFGVDSVSGRDQAVATVNCHVFEKASRTQPVGTGQWLAMLDSAHLNVVLGCVEDESGLIRYESIRRGLSDSWARDVAGLDGQFQFRAQNSKAGQQIASKIKLFPSADQVCRQKMAIDERRRGGKSMKIDATIQKCGEHVYLKKTPELCNESAHVIRAVNLASGVRDDWSWIGELYARHQRSSNLCDTADAYPGWRVHVPAHIFDGLGARLAIPNDALMACAQRESYLEINRQSRFHGNLYKSLNSLVDRCARRWPFGAAFKYESQPERFTRDAILNGSWVYDPKTGIAGNACVEQTALDMRAAGINPPHPRALEKYCSKLP